MYNTSQWVMGQMGIKKKMDIIHININLISYISNITFNSNTQNVHTKFTSRVQEFYLMILVHMLSFHT